MMTKQVAVIFDIDGTLADIRHRLHFIQGEKKDWDGFNSVLHLDRIKLPILHLLNLYKAEGFKIILCTGRQEKYRDATAKWLLDNGVEWDELYMRPTDDLRPDSVIKDEIYHHKIKPNFLVYMVVDDRDRVVEIWRKNGLTCLQCQKGDY